MSYLTVFSSVHLIQTAPIPGSLTPLSVIAAAIADHDPAIITTHEVLTKKMMMLQLMHTYIASSMGIVFYLYSLNDEFVEDHSSWKLGLIALIWSTRNILMSSTRMREL